MDTLFLVAELQACLASKSVWQQDKRAVVPADPIKWLKNTSTAAEIRVCSIPKAYNAIMQSWLAEESYAPLI